MIRLYPEEGASLKFPLESLEINARMWQIGAILEVRTKGL